MDKKFVKGIAAGAIGFMCLQGTVFATSNILCNGIGIYAGANEKVLGDDTSQTLTKMNNLKQCIDQYFMDDVKEEDLTEGIYKGMLEGLGDPYSCYFTKEEYEDLMADSSGTYCGIGASVMEDTESGMIRIVVPFEGGAAKEAGLQSGDLIRKVQGEDVIGKDLTEVVALMKGKEGTTVEVECYLAKEKKVKTFELERREVEVPTVAYEMKKDKIGYIAVSGFDEPTDEQFIHAVKDLQKQGIKAVVIDLRNNGGGMLVSVVNMLDYLLPKGSVLVSTKDKNGEGETYKAETDTSFDLPMAVLINGNTASASEVFSGAIQDYKMGIIVGTTSFGKGIVQSVLPLNDGTAVKLTTSKYYTPNGRNIHGTGIEPDVKVELDAEDDKDTQYEQAVKILKRELQK